MNFCMCFSPYNGSNISDCPGKANRSPVSLPPSRHKAFSRMRVTISSGINPGKTERLRIRQNVFDNGRQIFLPDAQL